MATRTLLDERSPPPFRHVWGRLLSRADAADSAVTRVRLVYLDFTAQELARVQRLRLLLADVNAERMDAEAHVVFVRPDRAPPLRRLMALLAEGRIQVRSAPLGGWSPDFTVFSDTTGPHRLVVGSHRFDGGSGLRGPLFRSLHGRRAAARAAERFNELWREGHDVRSAIAAILERADRQRDGGPEGSRNYRPATPDERVN